MNMKSSESVIVIGTDADIFAECRQRCDFYQNSHTGTPTTVNFFRCAENCARKMKQVADILLLRPGN